MAKDFNEVLKIVNDEIGKHTEASGYPTVQKTREDGQEGSGEDSAPRGASAKITAANKISARANSSAKTPTSSRATAAHAHRTPGSEAKAKAQKQKSQVLTWLKNHALA